MSKRPSILLTGAGGQLGAELAPALRAHGDVVATERATLDLADPDAIVAAVRGVRPALIVNAAAYTAVDLAEKEAATAYAVNARAAGILAEEAKRLGAVLIHYSTDYVFDGTRNTPYPEDAPRESTQRVRGEQARGRAGDRGNRWPRAGVAHELGLRRFRQEFPGHDSAPRRRARRAAHRRGPGRRPQLDPRARPGRPPGSWPPDCRRWPSGRGSITCRRRARRAGTTSRAPSSAPAPRPRVVPIATADYPLPARRPAYGVLATAGSRRRSASRFRIGATRSPPASRSPPRGRGERSLARRAARAAIVRRPAISAGRTCIRRRPSSGRRSSCRRSWP